MLFASSLFGFSFTTEQFAQIYADTYGGFPAAELAKRLWGDIWFDEGTRKFKRSAPAGGGTRSFVHFVIEPLYKMFSQAVGEEPKDLVKVMSELGINLNKRDSTKDVKPLTRCIMTNFFGNHTGLVDVLSKGLPSPARATKRFIEMNYTGEACLPQPRISI